MNLKYPYKEVLYLQYYNELGSKEIGEILSIKPDNVRKIASRARKILKEKMIEMGIWEMTDKKFEELLKEAVEQCVEKEWEEISQKSKKIRYKPSKEFEEKMEKLYQKESCQNNFIGDEQTKVKVS